jgi:hypothetical protein
MKKRRVEVSKARQAMLAKMTGKGGSTTGPAGAAGTAAASGEAGGAMGGGIRLPAGCASEAIPGSEISATGMMRPVQASTSEELGPWAAGLVNREGPAAAAASGQQQEAGPFPSFTFGHNLPTVEQSASFDLGGGRQQGTHAQREMQHMQRLQQQQQQQQQEFMPPQQQQRPAAISEDHYSDTTSVTSSMQHSQAALLHPRLPTAHTARTATNAPLSSAQHPTESIPGAAGRAKGAGYSGPREGPTPCYIAPVAPVVVDPQMPRLYFRKPLQRVPLFVREFLDARGAKRHAVASYTPASLQLGELFEVGAAAALANLLLSALFCGETQSAGSMPQLRPAAYSIVHSCSSAFSLMLHVCATTAVALLPPSIAVSRQAIA